MKLYWELITHVIDIELPEAEEIANQMVKEASSHNIPDGIAAAKLQLGCIYERKGKTKEALSFLNFAYDHFSLKDDFYYQSEALLTLAIIHRGLGNYREALGFAARALALQERLNSPENKAKISVCIAWCYALLTDYKSALASSHQALHWARMCKNKKYEAGALSVLAAVHQLLDEHREAIALYKTCLEICEQHKCNNLILSNCLNLAFIFYEIEDYDSVLFFGLRSLSLSIHNEKKRSAAGAYNVLAKTYLKTGRRDLANEMLSKALATSQEINNKLTYTHALAVQAEFHLADLNTLGAIEVYTKILSAVESQEDLHLQVDVLRSLLAIYEQSRDFEKAFETQKHLTDVQLQLREEQMHKEIVLINAKIDTSQMEEEEKFKEIQTYQTSALIENQTCELSALAIQLAQRRTFLLSLREELKGMRSRGFSDKELRALSQRIDNELASERRQGQVDELLKKLTPEFNTLLKVLYPTFSVVERKVCLLLKIGLKTNEIATLLSTSERTVEHHRFHIRKKMALPTEQSLQNHLSRLVNERTYENVGMQT